MSWKKRNKQEKITLGKYYFTTRKKKTMKIENRFLLRELKYVS